VLLDGDMKERREPVLGNNLAVVDAIGFYMSGFLGEVDYLHEIDEFLELRKAIS